MPAAKDRRRSRQLFAEAERYLPGGVSSPARAFRAVGGEPLVIASGAGPRIQDADGASYIDYVGAFGPLALGHAHPAVVEAIAKAAAQGMAYGATSELEIELARTICGAIPSVDLLRFVNSGTEATMSALRLSRAFTGRDKVLKFAGCYHGHADGLLVQAGSGQATLGLPDSPGVPASYARETIVAPYNDMAAVEGLFKANAGGIAAVIVEPVAANMGVVPPADGFLQGLRRVTRDAGTLLIFDEVVTGFRLDYGSAQDILGVEADLTCLGKIIGGGLPVGAFGGRAEIMEMLAPVGPVYQAGTLSGNPLVMAAGLATLACLREEGSYERLEEMGAQLEDGIRAALERAGVVGRINRAGSMLTLFFAADPVTDYVSAKRADTEQYGRFFRALLASGVYFPPSQFEAAFVSLAHGRQEVEETLSAVDSALNAAKA